jgi:hypothetical protein
MYKKIVSIILGILLIISCTACSLLESTTEGQAIDPPMNQVEVDEQTQDQ